MISLLRQNKISKWFSGIGQEAISCGVAYAMDEDEYVLPMHRNLGYFTGRGFPLDKLVAQWQGKLEGYTKGRDRSFHFGYLPKKTVGMISHLGPQLGIADGLALAEKIKGSGKTVLGITGDGGTSEGDFHEALNVASVWKLPVIFLVENNGYGLSTPNEEQFAMGSFEDKCHGYGMQGKKIDGNNILEVIREIRKAKETISKNEKPFLLECLTFRMRGHEESSGTKYIPKELMEYWAERDPVLNYQDFLVDIGLLNEKAISEIRQKMKSEIDIDIDKGFAGEEPKGDLQEELSDMYYPYQYIKDEFPEDKGERSLRFVDAISEGLSQSMEQHPELILMGQDIAGYGGVFKVTEGFLEKFGKERVRNTPLCESAIIGTALGLSMQGYKAMVEMQFSDFVTCGFNQIVNNLAKIHYRWGANADVVVRMPTGGGVGAGPFHSQSTEGWFTHVPGLQIVYPSNPYDSKGLLAESFRNPNPVLFFEHKYLYRSISGVVPESYYTLPFGKARLVREGVQATIVTYGLGVHWAADIAEKEGLDIDIIDLRTLSPLDFDAIEQSVKKTGRCLVLHEATKTSGFGAELSARIGEELFRYLDAPVSRVAAPDTPFPFADKLEKAFLPNSILKGELEKLLGW
ncbi:MAG: dehydrogenase E1 component subunit alpha/beta [Candidatus Kapaibacteriales bacterium]